MLKNYERVKAIESFLSFTLKMHEQEGFELSGFRSGSGLVFVQAKTAHSFNSMAIRVLGTKEQEVLRPLLLEQSFELFLLNNLMYQDIVSFNEQLDSIVAVVIGEAASMEAAFFGSKLSFARTRCSELLNKFDEVARILNGRKINIHAGQAKFK